MRSFVSSEDLHCHPWSSLHLAPCHLASSIRRQYWSFELDGCSGLVFLRDWNRKGARRIVCDRHRSAVETTPVNPGHFCFYVTQWPNSKRTSKIYIPLAIRTAFSQSKVVHSHVPWKLLDSAQWIYAAHAAVKCLYIHRFELHWTATSPGRLYLQRFRTARCWT